MHANIQYRYANQETETFMFISQMLVLVLNRIRARLIAKSLTIRPIWRCLDFRYIHKYKNHTKLIYLH